METRYLKPVKDMLVRLEDASRYVAAEGEELPDTAYYRRRVRDGDLMAAKRSKPKKD